MSTTQKDKCVELVERGVYSTLSIALVDVCNVVCSKMPLNCTRSKSVASVAVTDAQHFWKAIKLCITKPHTINRILSGGEIVKIYRLVNCNEANVNGQIIDQITSTLLNDDRSNGIDSFVEHFLQNTEKQYETISKSDFEHYDLENDDSIFIVLCKYFPRNLRIHQNSSELICLDPKRKETAFWNFKAKQCYGIDRGFIIAIRELVEEHKSFEISAYLLNPSNCSEYALRLTNQLKNVTLPKIKRWMTNDEEISCNTSAYSTGSLALIDLEEYNQLYNDLKVKYGEHMTKMWPEKTDPAKYVYEDVGIATYLLLLWKNERKQKNIDTLQTFVDIGCGNGLLVYILASEGHKGYGIDIRKRGIWDAYPATTILETRTIVPGEQSLFPDHDWLIGNHSDELSPWIPVMSALSSYHSRYFLLPCCAFEFNGKKYQRRAGSKSQYADFLDYLQRINTVCGFNAQIDRLKIPSTKRVCLIGAQRSYSIDQYDKQIQGIHEFIANESGSITQTTNSAGWINGFEARPEIQKIQNCTLVDRSIRDFIVELVFGLVMSKKRFLPDYRDATWNAGGIIELAQVAQIIPRDKLMALKSECGGLQTLLRNNGHIFCVTKGCVQLRLPVHWTERKAAYEKNARSKRQPFAIKQMPCWFKQNHPDGCPLPDSDCSYIH